MGGFGRFDRIDRYSDGSQEWDLYLDVGSIHVGGRVAVDARGRLADVAVDLGRTKARASRFRRTTAGLSSR